MRAAFSTGEVVFPSKRLALDVILLDSGALDDSYISSDFVHKFEFYFKPLLHYTPRVASMANGTPCVTQHSVILTVELLDHDGVIHSASVHFVVFPMKTNQMIIGLPHLLFNFGTLWISKLQSAVELLRTLSDDQRQAHYQQLQHHLNATALDFKHSDIPYGSLLENPWSTITAPAPEDDLTELPCSFTDALNYLEKGYDEALQEYFQQILDPKRIDPDFRHNTNVEDLLHTKGVLVFLPLN